MAEVENALVSYLKNTVSPTKLSLEERVEKALTYSTQVAGRWIVEGEVFISSIEADFDEVEEGIVPVYLKRGYSPNAEEEFSHYEFPNWPWEKWRSLLNRSNRMRKLILDRVGYNIMQGKDVPKDLRIIAGAHVMGMTEPLSSPPRKKCHRHRDTLLSGIAKRVSEDFLLPLGASKATFDTEPRIPIRGCTIAAAALFAYGLHVNPKRADAICRNPNLPVSLAESRGVFEARSLFVTQALMGEGEKSSQVVSAARQWLSLG